MTEIRYLERRRESDPFHSVAGVVDYISTSMKAKAYNSKKRGPALDNGNDTRDDSLQWTIPLNNSSMDMLGFDPTKVFNLNGSTNTHSQAVEETREEPERRTSSEKTTKKNVPQQDPSVVSVQSLNLAPEKVYTGMSKRYQDLLRDDDEQREGLSNPRAHVKNTKPTSRWQREQEDKEMKKEQDAESENFSPGAKRLEPPKFSVSKINRARAGPVPKSDDFFDELKKWHENYSLREVEKPEEITVTVADALVQNKEKDEEPKSVKESVSKSDSADSNQSSDNKKSKKKANYLLWNRKQPETDLITDLEVKQDRSSEQKQEKQQKSLLMQNSLMKEIMSVSNRTEENTSSEKAHGSHQTEAAGELQSDEFVASSKQRKKIWGMKLPKLSRKKRKGSKKSTQTLIYENTDCVVDESVSSSPDPPSSSKTAFSSLGLSQSSTSKPIKPPSFGDALNKFILLEKESREEVESEGDKFVENAESSDSSASKTRGLDEEEGVTNDGEQLENEVITLPAKSTDSLQTGEKNVEEADLKVQEAPPEPIRMIISTASSIDVKSKKDGYQVIVETVSSGASETNIIGSTKDVEVDNEAVTLPKRNIDPEEVCEGKQEDEERVDNDGKTLSETEIAATGSCEAVPEHEADETEYAPHCLCYDNEESWFERASKFFFFTHIDELHKVRKDNEGGDTDNDKEDKAIEGPSSEQEEPGYEAEQNVSKTKDDVDQTAQSNESPTSQKEFTTSESSLLDTDVSVDMASMNSNSIGKVNSESNTSVGGQVTESHSCADSKNSGESCKSAVLTEKSVAENASPDDSGSCQESKTSKQSWISKASKKSLLSISSRGTENVDDKYAMPTEMIILPTSDKKLDRDKDGRSQDESKDKRKAASTKSRKEKKSKGSKKSKKKRQAVTLFGRLESIPESGNRKTKTKA